MPPLPLENAVDKTNLPLRDKLALFGPSAIPLILPPGTKGKWNKEKGEPWHNYYRYRKNWGTRTKEDTLAPSYQHDLYNTPCNVAVPQGIKTRLGAFDFDVVDADIWEEFFSKNPQFKKNALITIGAKGFTLWILFEGDFSLKWHSIKFGGSGNVEWRSEGNYSVVHGKHPAGMFYQCWVIGQGLVPLKWASLVCPSARWKEWPPLIEPEKRTQSLKAHAPLTSEQAENWEAWIREAYEVIDDSDPLKWRVKCPGEKEHSTDSREEDTILFTGIDGSIPNFHCSHSHCTGEGKTNEIESRRIQAAFFALEKIIIYQDSEALSAEMDRFYIKLAQTGEFFARNRSDPPHLVRWRPGMPREINFTVNTFIGQSGAAHISFGKYKKDKIISCLPPREIIKDFLHHTSQLPLATRIIHSPILVRTEGGAEIVTQKYVPDLEAIVLGDPAQTRDLEMELGEAKDWLLKLVSFWKWVDKIDLARAYSELFTPALLAGGFIKRPVPAFLITADQPDAGKTFWHKAVGWIYGEDVDSNTLAGRTTIGGLEELLSDALYHGENFFFVDELDGKIKSPIMNALLTGAGRKKIRLPFHPMSEVDIEQFVLLLAGVRGFTLEEQFATRIIPMRINRPNGSGFAWSDSGGELVSSWIQKNQGKFLAAIYAVIKKWVLMGEPVSEPDCRFPSWSVGINGVLENVLETNKVTFELVAAQGELSNPIVAWSEEVYEVAPKFFWTQGLIPTYFTINQLRKLVTDAGLGIPGCDMTIRDSSALEKNQNRVLAMKFKALKIVDGPDDRGTIVYRLGKYFLIRYRCGNTRGGDPFYRYLLSQHNAIPVDPKEYVEELV